ncbi:hypothetical protein BDW59DRAFT_22216 [Aspergillus cavernicola]|uniref:Uncharacterized protein n=1 Tax=Aspergillus cavernicola TaxID=176166 RepID=A0ABR4IR17_9EURO
MFNPAFLYRKTALGSVRCVLCSPCSGTLQDQANRFCEGKQQVRARFLILKQLDLGAWTDTNQYCEALKKTDHCSFS